MANPLFEEAQRQSRIAQIPTGDMRAPAADGSQNSALNTEFGRNLTNTLNAIPGAAGLAAGLAGRALGASAPAMGLAGRAAQSVGPYAPVAAGAAALMSAQAPQNQTAPARSQTGTPMPSSPPMPQNGAGMPQSPTGGTMLGSDVTRVGNSYSGTNVSGNITINGQAPRGGGVPSDQNMAAADGMAARQGLASYAAAQQQPGVPQLQAPVVRSSANDWQARNDLRNAEASASSIMNRAEWNRAGKADAEGKIAGFRAAQAADVALRAAQPGMDQAAMRENAGLQREGLSQQGANNRSLVQAALDQQRIDQAGATQGFQNRAAAQQEQLRNVLLDPNATPEQRKIAQRSLAVLGGKTAADRLQTVALPDTTNEMGQVMRGGQALVRTLEDGSVQQVPIGAQQSATANPYRDGQELRGKDGKTYVVKNGVPVLK